MFPQFIAAIESYKYITWDWYEITPLDLNTKVVSGIIFMRQLIN